MRASLAPSPRSEVEPNEAPHLASRVAATGTARDWRGPWRHRNLQVAPKSQFFCPHILRFRPGHILQDSIYPAIRRGARRAHISRRQLTDADSQCHSCCCQPHTPPELAATQYLVGDDGGPLPGVCDSSRAAAHSGSGWRCPPAAPPASFT